MILLDYSQVVIGSIMAVSKGQGVVEENMLRHVILNTIRQFRNQFLDDYGEIVICCDHYKNWRKELFPNYKAVRKKSKAASDTDWKYLYECLNIMREDLREYFPYRVIQVEGAEADDIIGVLTDYCMTNPTLIISSDKDFIQLQMYQGVCQWSPLQKKWVTGDPEESLWDKIIRGDTGDGVPNILSGDDVFITEGVRQRPITKKKMDLWKSDKSAWTEEMRRNYLRNQQLVDLSKTPESIRINISNEYEKESKTRGNRARILDYFVNKRLKNLMEFIEEF